MKLSNILKQFKTIEPGKDFAVRSRAEILLSPQNEPLTMRGVFAVFRALEAGAAVALAGLFMLILTGSLSGPDVAAPIQYSVIDPAGLHAEADAVDMQIELANLAYPQSTSTEANGSTAPATEGLAPVLSKLLAGQSTSSASAAAAAVSATSSATSTPSSTLSIDQALKALSQ